MSVISNSSPLIALSRIDSLYISTYDDILIKLFKIGIYLPEQ